jgi:hypothetical protein
MSYMNDTRSGHLDNNRKVNFKKMTDEMRSNGKAMDLEKRLLWVRYTKALKENIEKVLEFDLLITSEVVKLAFNFLAILASWM